MVDNEWTEITEMNDALEDYRLLCAKAMIEIEQAYRGIVKSEIIRVRLETIEECARKVEALDYTSPDELKRIAAAIRALKSPPPSDGTS